MPLKLYKLDLSPPVRAVIMLCDIYKLPLELIDVDMRNGGHRTPEYLKLNPLHTVPTLVDGDTVVNDSHAILIYLSDVYGKNGTLYPEDVKKRALVNQKLFFNATYLFPRMRNVTYPIFMSGKKGVEQKQLDDIEEVYGFFEAFLSQAKYLALDNLTIADVAALPSMNGLTSILPLNAERYPKSTAWLKIMEQQPYSQKHNAAPAKALGQIIQSAINQ